MPRSLPVITSRAPRFAAPLLTAAGFVACLLGAGPPESRAQEFPYPLTPVFAGFDASGNAQFPPEPPGYFTSHPNVLIVKDGMPAGVGLVGRMELRNVVITSESPGGLLGGEVTEFTADVVLVMNSVGAFPGWSRTMTLPAVARFHSGPQVPGSTPQDFDIELDQLLGQVLGDPDFDLLRITAGSGFGMPSPGHTTARYQPAGDYHVDSFFDITYRIDFVGAPGGTFAGMSGSTVNVVRQRSGHHDTGACSLPDNSFGTVDWPPACPAGTRGRTEGVIAENGPVPTWAMVADMDWHAVPGSVVSAPGGDFGGEVVQVDQLLRLDIHGEGLLASYARNITVPVQSLFHVGPEMPLLPHQGRAVDISQLTGQITGDPDFDLLRISSGSAFGLPSAGGHTSLTRETGGNWAVDSFFDITYRIDFVGAPGGPLAGLSGSHTASLRCQMGQPREAGCDAPDNGLGTIDFPPLCAPGYRSVMRAPAALSGTPAGSALLVDAEIQPARLLGSAPGGSLGGEQQASDAKFRLHVVGTGLLAGFERNLSTNGPLETHTAPHVTALSPQHFEVLIHQTQGVITGDPDFDLLRITAGNGFGLPSPGHTTLVTAGPDWHVDSFFDITYRIDFIGAPGSPLAGMSGSTTARRNFVVGAQPTLGIPAPSLPARLHLGPATPNPARGSTTFALALPGESHVRATVHDVLGRTVRVLANGSRAAGTHTLAWDGRGDGGRPVPPGLYLVRVQDGRGAVSRRVFVTR